jgi:hypothetical protein
MKRQLEVADIFRAYGPVYRNNHKLPTRHLRAMRAIEICRTAELGGHIYKCDTCGAVSIAYNSCRYKLTDGLRNAGLGWKRRDAMGNV